MIPHESLFLFYGYILPHLAVPSNTYIIYLIMMLFLEDFLIKTVPKLTNLCVFFIFCVIWRLATWRKTLEKEKEKEREIKMNVGQFDATRWQQQSRVASRGRLPTGGNRNMKIYSKRRRRRRGQQTGSGGGGEGVSTGKVCGNCQRILSCEKKRIIFICLTHMRLLRRTTTTATCGMWHVVSAAIECGDCVAFPVCSCQNAKCRYDEFQINSHNLPTVRSSSSSGGSGSLGGPLDCPRQSQCSHRCSRSRRRQHCPSNGSRRSKI